MSVRPDEREALFYDIMNLFSIDPDSMPHYYTTVFDKFRMLQDMRQEKRPFCATCNTCLDIFGFNGRFCCPKEYEPKFGKGSDGEYIITNITKLDRLEPNHKIMMETPIETLNRLILEVCLYLQSSNKAVRDIYMIENFMYGKPEGNFIETVNGDITKAQIKRRLYQIKQFLIDELIKLRSEIRFSSMLRTPSLRLG